MAQKLILLFPSLYITRKKKPEESLALKYDQNQHILFPMVMLVRWVGDFRSDERYKIAKHTHKYMMIIIVYAASVWRHCFKVHGAKQSFRSINIVEMKLGIYL